MEIREKRLIKMLREDHLNVVINADHRGVSYTRREYHRARQGRTGKDRGVGSPARRHRKDPRRPAALEGNAAPSSEGEG